MARMGWRGGPLDGAAPQYVGNWGTCEGQGHPEHHSETHMVGKAGSSAGGAYGQLTPSEPKENHPRAWKARSETGRFLAFGPRSQASLQKAQGPGVCKLPKPPASRALCHSLFTFMHGRRKRQPTPVFLPREPQGLRGLVGCRLWGRTESDTTETT